VGEQEGGQAARTGAVGRDARAASREEGRIGCVSEGELRREDDVSKSGGLIEHANEC
jgi:hypothetical protein